MLILPAALRAQLLAEAKTAFPAECCGLLGGVRDGEGVGVTALHPSANLSSTPNTAFEIDPALHFRLLRGLRGTGREVVGCYHSHPTGKALPSPRDRANGCEDGFVWVIIATSVNDALAAFHGPLFQPLAIKSP
jgi:proteasome lid subunit RPN8/RPN11